MNTVLVIVPAYNEEHNIELVLNELIKSDKNIDIDILVINDGSKDRTADIAKDMNIDVINLPFNLGYGSALQTGYKYAVKKGYQYVISYDADYQHRANDLSIVYSILVNNKSDIVIGSRFLKRQVQATFLKNLAFLLFRTLIKVLTKKMITDPTSGFQGLNRKAFHFYSKMDNYSPDFPDADILIMMIWEGFRIVEVPISIRERKSGKSMHNGIKPLIYFLKVFLSILIIIFRNKILKEIDK